MAKRAAKTAKKPKAGAPSAKSMKRGRGGAENSSVPILGGVELGELRRLIDLVQETGIGELEVRSGARTIRISAPGSGSSVATVAEPVRVAAGSADSAKPSPAADSSPKTDHAVPIVSPMVGTFYRAPAPDADPYVEVGDHVEVGQTVCIVEAMKLMNEIESEVRGRIVKILPENAQPVEFGQKLFLVEPA